MRKVIFTIFLISAIWSCKKENNSNPNEDFRCDNCVPKSEHACWDCLTEFLYSLPPDTVKYQDSTIRPGLIPICDFDSMNTFENSDFDTLILKDGILKHWWITTTCK